MKCVDSVHQRKKYKKSGVLLLLFDEVNPSM